MNALEAQMARVHTTLYPEPEFDSGWIELPAHAGMELSPDEPLAIKRYDVLLRTGPEEFEAVGTSAASGPIWQRPAMTGFGTIRAVLVYSMATEARQVRLQGWYADNTGKHAAH